MFTKEIKQLDLGIRTKLTMSVARVIETKKCIQYVNNTEYNYYILGFWLECEPAPRGSFRKALKMTKHKESVINRAMELRADGDEIALKFYNLVMNLKDMEDYLITLIKHAHASLK